MSFLENFKLRTLLLSRRRDRGFVLISTLLLFAIVGGLSYSMLAATGRTITSSSMTRDFGQAGQLADYAIQDAVFQLNESTSPHLPSKLSPRYSTEDLDGDGVKDWNWYVDALPATGEKVTTIHAEGTSRGATRKVSATVGALTVGGYVDSGTDQISYEISPESAFSHVVLGRNITLQNGANAGSGVTYLKGAVGVTSAKPVTTPAPGTKPVDEANYRLYGTDAGKHSVGHATRVPAAVHLDAAFVTENNAMCRGTTASPWVASEHGGLLPSNNTIACYSSMTFDVPTTITGSGAANVFVAGKTTVAANISAPSTAALNLYTGGNVEFAVERSVGGSMTVKNMFIYAPTGVCKTAVEGDASKFRPSTKSLTFTGSIACDTVKVAGTFTGKIPIKPMGSGSFAGSSAVFNSEVWYLADYQQPAGTRTH